MTDSVTPRAPDPPLVDPETGETPPLSPQRPPTYAEILVLVVDPHERTAFIEGSWDHVRWEVTEPDDAA